MEKESKVTVILGRRGTGKTYKAKELLNEWRRNFVVWDFIGEYDNGTVISDINVFYDQVKFNVEHEERIAIVLRIIADQDLFQDICMVVEDLGKSLGDLLFVIEEVDSVSSPNYCPTSLESIIRYGRHSHISLITTSRRPADIPRILTSQGDYLYLFSIIEPVDLKYLKMYASIDPEEIKKLSKEKHECLKIDLD